MHRSLPFSPFSIDALMSSHPGTRHPPPLYYPPPYLLFPPASVAPALPLTPTSDPRTLSAIGQGFPPVTQIPQITSDTSHMTRRICAQTQYLHGVTMTTSSSSLTRSIPLSSCGDVMRYGVDDVQTTPSRAGGAVGGTRQHDAPSHVTTAGQGVTRTDDRPLLDHGTSVSTLRGNASASRRHNGLPTRPPDVACVTYSRNFSRDHALDTRISGNSGNDETPRLLGDRGEPIFSLWRDSERWPRLVKGVYVSVFV